MQSEPPRFPHEQCGKPAGRDSSNTAQIGDRGQEEKDLAEQRLVGQHFGPSGKGRGKGKIQDLGRRGQDLGSRKTEEGGGGNIGARGIVIAAAKVPHDGRNVSCGEWKRGLQRCDCDSVLEVHFILFF